MEGQQAGQSGACCSVGTARCRSSSCCMPAALPAACAHRFSLSLQMPWAKIERERHNRDLTAAEAEKRQRQAVERDERRRRRITQVGGRGRASRRGEEAERLAGGTRGGACCVASVATATSPVCSPLAPCRCRQALITTTKAWRQRCRAGPRRQSSQTDKPLWPGLIWRCLLCRVPSLLPLPCCNTRAPLTQPPWLSIVAMLVYPLGCPAAGPLSLLRLPLLSAAPCSLLPPTLCCCAHRHDPRL